jgi:hypothetical protein
MLDNLERRKDEGGFIGPLEHNQKKKQKKDPQQLDDRSSQSAECSGNKESRFPAG